MRPRRSGRIIMMSWAMAETAELPFAILNTALKAAGETTRLRILALLAEAELTVSDLTEILRQSQPRISRHLKLLSEAGLVERFREGSWAFFRFAEGEAGAQALRELIGRLSPRDPVIARDREKLAAVRGARGGGAKLFPPPRRGMGPHPQAACCRCRGGEGDPRRAGRPAGGCAARS